MSCSYSAFSLGWLVFVNLWEREVGTCSDVGERERERSVLVYMWEREREFGTCLLVEERPS